MGGEVGHRLGRLRGDAAFDPLVQAVSGAMHAQGGADEPVFHAVPLNDVMTPAIAAFGVLAALFYRARGGGGQRVRTALARTGLDLSAESAAVVGALASAAIAAVVSGDDEATTRRR